MAVRQSHAVRAGDNTIWSVHRGKLAGQVFAPGGLYRCAPQHFVNALHITTANVYCGWVSYSTLTQTQCKEHLLSVFERRIQINIKKKHKLYEPVVTFTLMILLFIKHFN